jgi:hypothetical protein
MLVRFRRMAKSRLLLRLPSFHALPAYKLPTEGNVKVKLDY